MAGTDLEMILESRRVNAALGWLLVLVLSLALVGSALDGHVVWAGFTGAVAALVVLPPLAHRSVEVMLPWEVVALATLPVVGRTVVIGETIDGFTFTGLLSTYLAVAAVALIVAVELDVFTPVEMNSSFAVLFVVVATMAAAGIWGIAQWLADIYLGTAFLVDGTAVDAEAALMWDFVAATAVGVVAGVIFEYYFRRRSRAGRRVPTEVEAS